MCHPALGLQLIAMVAEITYRPTGLQLFNNVIAVRAITDLFELYIALRAVIEPVLPGKFCITVWAVIVTHCSFTQ